MERGPPDRSWSPQLRSFTRGRQAIDRAHRNGQERPVFAGRIIARNTVEEKALELQRAKRDLAESLLGAGNSLILIGELTKGDLELPLS